MLRPSPKGMLSCSHERLLGTGWRLGRMMRGAFGREQWRGGGCGCWPLSPCSGLISTRVRGRRTAPQRAEHRADLDKGPGHELDEALTQRVAATLAEERTLGEGEGER